MTSEQLTSVAKSLLRGFRSNLYDEDDLVQDAHVAQLTTGQWPRRAMVDALRRWYGLRGKHHEFRGHSLPLPCNLMHQPNPADDIYRQEIKTLAAKQFDALPAKARCAAYLRYIDERQQDDIAKILGCTEGRVSQMLSAIPQRMSV